MAIPTGSHKLKRRRSSLSSLDFQPPDSIEIHRRRQRPNSDPLSSAGSSPPLSYRPTTRHRQGSMDSMDSMDQKREWDIQQAYEGLGVLADEKSFRRLALRHLFATAPNSQPHHTLPINILFIYDTTEMGFLDTLVITFIHSYLSVFWPNFNDQKLLRRQLESYFVLLMQTTEKDRLLREIREETEERTTRTEYQAEAFRRAAEDAWLGRDDVENGEDLESKSSSEREEQPERDAAVEGVTDELKGMGLGRFEDVEDSLLQLQDGSDQSRMPSRENHKNQDSKEDDGAGGDQGGRVEDSSSLIDNSDLSNSSGENSNGSDEEKDGNELGGIVGERKCVQEECSYTASSVEDMNDHWDKAHEKKA